MIVPNALTKARQCIKIWARVVNGTHACGCSSMVEHRLPKPATWVRFPSPAPSDDNISNEMFLLYLKQMVDR